MAQHLAVCSAGTGESEPPSEEALLLQELERAELRRNGARAALAEMEARIERNAAERNRLTTMTSDVSRFKRELAAMNSELAEVQRAGLSMQRMAVPQLADLQRELRRSEENVAKLTVEFESSSSSMRDIEEERSSIAQRIQAFTEEVHRADDLAADQLTETAAQLAAELANVQAEEVAAECEANETYEAECALKEEVACHESAAKALEEQRRKALASMWAAVEQEDKNVSEMELAVAEATQELSKYQREQEEAKAKIKQLEELIKASEQTEYDAKTRVQEQERECRIVEARTAKVEEECKAVVALGEWRHNFMVAMVALAMIVLFGAHIVALFAGKRGTAA